MPHHPIHPVIGITTYGKNEQGDLRLPARYAEAVRAVGGIPILLPPGEPHAEQVLALVDGLILAGGGDIAPHLYGGKMHPSVYLVDEERDRFELALARLGMEGTTPLLGICRGAQVLTVAAGGRLIEHVPDEVGTAVIHRAPPLVVQHPVIVEPDSRLATILGTGELPVPSWHHQAARDVPPGWRLAAHAPDGVIEAIEHEHHPYLIGVQWHPEEAPQDERQRRLFHSLVVAAREGRVA